MIIRQFLAWTQDTSPTRRAEAAAALARAYLHGGLGEEAAWEAKTAILALLDDPAPAVRRALAEACASCANAPRALVVALSADQPEIAGLVLARSPVLTDADLVDGVAIGCAATRTAIAGRADLSPAVAGALAEIGEPASLIALARNHGAVITTGTLLRMIERHGGDAPLREALLRRPGLPLEVRQAVTARLAQSLSAFAVEAGWLSPVRSERAGREARERATLALSVDAHPIDVARLVTHLRGNGQLNAGLLLRAILSGRMAFVEAALANLSGLGPDRVAGLMQEASGSGFVALHRRAGLPAALLPAFTAALSAWREAGRGAHELTASGLSRKMIERALTACEAMPFAEAQSVMALLARYEAEAAREEARAAAKVLGSEAREAAELESEILEVEWREAQRQVTYEASWSRPVVAAAEATVEAEAVVAEAAPIIAEALPAAADAETDAADAGAAAGEEAPRAIDAVLDALPDAILASFREDRERQRAAAVLDAIPGDLIASYREDRERVRLAA
ncbi:DUF2336 domain-containing protein [Methylobacterium iners]|uniref:DUF2336 domain-containing protein n=1 Tax=Methylobacterium iners TaxID=418707 RepID=A0ABQ4S444_9HYPH|nr:DUF2336 domain-containing protein [Methylobacterium iners]GJD97243.1 hypothetical protein OCOJLMKI_4471 [Methylobacterium iners]